MCEEVIKMYPPITYTEYKTILMKTRVNQLTRYRQDDEYKTAHPQSVASRRFFSCKSVWRDDVDTECEGVWSRCCYTFRQVERYIGEIRRMYEKDDNPGADKLKERMWWDCVWYELSDGKCEDIQHFALSADGELICFGRSSRYRCGKRKRLFEDCHYFDNPHNVIVPFELGDVIKIDVRPFGKPLFAVWGENAEVRGHSEELAYIYRAEDRPILAVTVRDHIDYISLPYVPLERIHKLERCDDVLLMEASKLLRERPELWENWINQRGGLEHQFLPGLEGVVRDGLLAPADDSGRIYPLVHRLKEVWRWNADLRLGQLIVKCLEQSDSPVQTLNGIGDEALIEQIERTFATLSGIKCNWEVKK